MSEPVYVPGPGDDQWQRRRPEQAGLDADALAGAVDWAEAHETRVSRSLKDALDDLTQGEGVHAAIL